MNLHEMVIKQLDAQLKYWQEANQQAPRPKVGWVRTIRKALGMTIIQLANRLDLDPSRIVKIETTEIHGNITLQTMQETAEALNCEFVYALIPKISLKSILLEKAKNVIKKRIERISHSMALEDQSVSKNYQDEEMEDFKLTYLSSPRRVNSLWNEPTTMASSQKKRINTKGRMVASSVKGATKGATKTGRRKPRGRKK